MICKKNVFGHACTHTQSETAREGEEGRTERQGARKEGQNGSREIKSDGEQGICQEGIVNRERGTETK